MIEKWGLIIAWDIPNDCYIASVPELLACTGTGRTRQEALEALEKEVEDWLQTSRELGYSHAASETQAQALPIKEPQPARHRSAEPPSNSKIIVSQDESKIELSKPLTVGPLTLTTARNLPIVFLAGEGDISNCSSLRQACDDVFASGQHELVVDMTRLAYLDSSILGVLVNILKKFRSVDGFVCLVRSKEPYVNRLLAITRFDSIFLMADNLEEALEKLETTQSAPL